MSLTPEQIEENWNKFYGLLGKLGNRAAPAQKLVESFGTRLAMAPASSRKDFHNCFPGGLIEHSLRVLTGAIKLDKAFGWNIDKKSLIIGCLFHDIGKAGDLEGDLYIDNDSQWHRENLGKLYNHNDAIKYMSVPDRGLWLCQHFSLNLTQDEYLSIKLHDGQYVSANDEYKMKEPALAIVVHLADLIATKQEKGDLD